LGSAGVFSMKKGKRAGKDRGFSEGESLKRGRGIRLPSSPCFTFSRNPFPAVRLELCASFSEDLKGVPERCLIASDIFFQGNSAGGGGDRGREENFPERLTRGAIEGPSAFRGKKKDCTACTSAAQGQPTVRNPSKGGQIRDSHLQ